MNHPQQVFPHNADSADVDNLLGRVAELERTQLAEDVDGFLALFKPDAVWVTGGGQRLIGREQISDFTRRVLPGAFENASVRYDVEVISFVTPDVAVTGVNQQYTDSGGIPPARDYRPTSGPVTKGHGSSPPAKTPESLTTTEANRLERDLISSVRISSAARLIDTY